MGKICPKWGILSQRGELHPGGEYCLFLEWGIALVGSCPSGELSLVGSCPPTGVVHHGELPLLGVNVLVGTTPYLS